jgi:hypothetical protein
VKVSEIKTWGEIANLERFFPGFFTLTSDLMAEISQKGNYQFAYTGPELILSDFFRDFSHLHLT